MTIVIDDHLLRDWMAPRDRALVAAVESHAIATTSLWYARLCKSAARPSRGALLSSWTPVDRHRLLQTLIALPDEIVIVPMRRLAWQMGELIAEHHGLSMLGAEAVAATVALDAGLLVSARDDGPGIRTAAAAVRVPYETLSR